MLNKEIGRNSSGWLPSFVSIIRNILNFILSIFRTEAIGPTISSFLPIRGCPGIALEVNGYNFSPSREDNHVKVGGAQAHVTAASANRLKIITGYDTKTGPLEIEVDGRYSNGPVDFQALDWPDQRSEDGPPILFTGMGKGSNGKDMPSTGDQNVLIVLCHPVDMVPPDPDALRDAVNDTFDQVHAFYEQVSYGRLNLIPTVTTGWCTLDHNHDYYYTELSSGRMPLNNYSGIIPQAARYASEEALGGVWTTESEITYLSGFTLIIPMIYLGHDGSEAKALDDSDLMQYSDLGIDIVNPSFLWSRIVIEDAADWKTWAHEIGHCMVCNPVLEHLGEGLGPWREAAILGEDLYSTVDFADASAADFDLMGHHYLGALFSAYYMEELGYYNPDNICTISRLDPETRDFNNEYTVVAHGINENENPERYHLIKIQVGYGLYYYIEVRHRPDPASATPQLFDENIPLDGATNDGGVVVTKVFAGTVNMNQRMRFITLLHNPRVLTQDDVVHDPARNLRITVVNDSIEERPLACQVRVEWSEVSTEEASDVDLWIQPWNENYATPDIWIDREPYGEFDSDDPELGLDPDGNRDRPRVDALNFFYGRVHCDGPEGLEVRNVQLTFYAVTPPGVGDNGNWAPLVTRGIPSIPTGSSAERAAQWRPEVGEHTCLKLYATGEGPTGERLECSAQENVFEFLEAEDGSIPVTVVFPVAIRNPRDERTAVLLSVRNVPEGFVAQFPHAWVWLDPLAERKMTLTIIPTRDYWDYKEKLQIPYASIKLSGWISRDYNEEIAPGIYPPPCLLPIGGIFTRVTPKKKVKPYLWESQKVSQSDIAVLEGKIIPGMSGEKIAVCLEDPAGRRRIMQVKTDVAGHFTAAFDLKQNQSLEAEPKPEEEPLPGVYVAQALIINSLNAAQSESNIVYLTK